MRIYLLSRHTHQQYRIEQASDTSRVFLIFWNIFKGDILRQHRTWILKLFSLLIFDDFCIFLSSSCLWVFIHFIPQAFDIKIKRIKTNQNLPQNCCYQLIKMNNHLIIEKNYYSSNIFLLFTNKLLLPLITDLCISKLVQTYRLWNIQQKTFFHKAMVQK